MKRNRETLQKLLEMDTTQLEVLKLAMEQNPNLEEREKEVFKGMLVFFQKYPIKDYRYAIEHAHLLKIKLKHFSLNKSLMEVKNNVIKSWIPKEHPEYLEVLKHEFVHLLNPNLPAYYRNGFNEGLTNLIMMDTYQIPLSQIHYMHITLLMRMLVHIYGFKSWVQTYQGQENTFILEEMQKVLGKDQLLFMQVANSFVNELEYVKKSLIEEALERGFLSDESQSEYVSYDIESTKKKMEIWKLISQLYQHKYGRMIELDATMMQYLDLYLKDVLTLQQISSPYIKQIEKVLRK